MRCKSLICLMLVLILMIPVVPHAEARSDSALLQGVALEQALAQLNEEDCPDRIRLDDTFSRFDYYNSDYLEMQEYDKILVLFREAPLKEFEELEERPDETYVGVDKGEYKVYLCADLMKRLPEERRATGPDDVDLVIMAETMFICDAFMQTSREINDLSADERELLDNTVALMEGEDTEDDAEDDEGIDYAALMSLLGMDDTTYHPLFTGVAMVAVYDWDTGASDYWHRVGYDYSELRSNPEADDTWDMMLEWLDLYGVAQEYPEETGDMVVLSWLLDGGYIPEEDILTVSELADDAIAAYCLEQFWALTETLGMYDPDNAGNYAQIRAEGDIEALFNAVVRATYAEIKRDTFMMKINEEYTGHPDLDELNEALVTIIDLLEVCQWNTLDTNELANEILFAE